MLSLDQPQGVGLGELSADLPPERVAMSGKLSGTPLLTTELQFNVRYSLTEYLSFMWQHGAYLIRRRRVRGLAGGWLRLRSTASAGFNFLLSGRGRRTYAFTIDAHGIVRTSGGVTLIGWPDVLALRSYSRGFMLVLQRGTLPIPYRCLSSRQRHQLRALVQSRHTLAQA